MLGKLKYYWIKFGELLGKVVSPIVLAVIFFGLVFPIGLLRRIFGRPIIKKDYDPGADTYRTAARPSQSMEDPF